MKPVDQTLFRPSAGRAAGNCWQAAVASLFELELAQVPNFMDGDYEPDSTEPFERYVAWCRSFGFTVVTCDQPVFDALGIGTGKSPRGDFLHAVVTLGTEVVHDPHPSRAGVVGLLTVDYFMPLNPASLVES